MTLALKFTRPGAIGSYSNFAWPVPNGKPGTWVGVKGDRVACENGIHACSLSQAFEWLNAECYVIELSGRVIDHGDKLVARRGRLVKQLTRWNETNQRLFAADCAEHVLPIFEKKCPKDDRPREAIEAARAFARGEIDDAAWDAAGAAARDAARDAAWDAAGAAAGDAAWDAAGAAAWDAAGAAARAAEQRWQLRRLTFYLGPKNLKGVAR